MSRAQKLLQEHNKLMKYVDDRVGKALKKLGPPQEVLTEEEVYSKVDKLIEEFNNSKQKNDFRQEDLTSPLMNRVSLLVESDSNQSSASDERSVEVEEFEINSAVVKQENRRFYQGVLQQEQTYKLKLLMEEMKAEGQEKWMVRLKEVFPLEKLVTSNEDSGLGPDPSLGAGPVSNPNLEQVLFERIDEEELTELVQQNKQNFQSPTKERQVLLEEKIPFKRRCGDQERSDIIKSKVEHLEITSDMIVDAFCNGEMSGQNLEDYEVDDDGEDSDKGETFWSPESRDNEVQSISQSIGIKEKPTKKTDLSKPRVFETLNWIKNEMETQALTYEDLKSVNMPKNDSSDIKIWKHAIRYFHVELHKHEALLRESYVYAWRTIADAPIEYFNDPEDVEIGTIVDEQKRLMYVEGWKENLDISLRLGVTFVERCRFRILGRYWFLQRIDDEFKGDDRVNVADWTNALKKRTQALNPVPRTEELIKVLAYFHLLYPRPSYLEKINNSKEQNKLPHHQTTIVEVDEIWEEILDTFSV